MHFQVIFFILDTLLIISYLITNLQIHQFRKNLKSSIEKKGERGGNAPSHLDIFQMWKIAINSTTVAMEPLHLRNVRMGFCTIIEAKHVTGNSKYDVSCQCPT